METKIIGSYAWEIVDYLNAFKSTTKKPVFCWMNDEMSSRHPDSYGTCLNYTEFFEAFDASVFTKEQWLDSAQYWVENDSVGKPLKLIGLYLQSEKDKIKFGS
jgi:nucleoside 2-deoxyribosyltransferase